MNITSFQTGILQVNTYVVPLLKNGQGTGKCFIVDPAHFTSDNSNLVLNYLKKNNLECVAILLTHGHFDHITGISAIKQQFPSAIIAIHQMDAGELGSVGFMNSDVLGAFGMDFLEQQLLSQPKAELLLKGGDDLSVVLGSDFDGWKVLHTPGHTPGCVCFYNAAEKVLISGDTLFYGTWGRTDMKGGDEGLIKKSLSFIKKTVSEDTKIYPGHDYSGFLLSDCF